MNLYVVGTYILSNVHHQAFLRLALTVSSYMGINMKQSRESISRWLEGQFLLFILGARWYRCSYWSLYPFAIFIAGSCKSLPRIEQGRSNKIFVSRSYSYGVMIITLKMLDVLCLTCFYTLGAFLPRYLERNQCRAYTQ